MPTYEYKCEDCGAQFEVFARMSDPDPTNCESCNSSALKKLLFPANVHYKGSGFYSTDYAAKSSGSSSESGSSNSSTSSDSGSSSNSSSSSGSSE